MSMRMSMSTSTSTGTQIRWWKWMKNCGVRSRLG
uniref:Uncharacterized protein n=1 Tax=Anguilla anguilla TaxID=7936 RepID=A0A0E9XU30_ANGAN